MQKFIDLYNNLKIVLKQEQETCDYIKENMNNFSYLDPNYRLSYGKIIAYCSVMKELQDVLNINEELLIDKIDLLSISEQI